VGMPKSIDFKNTKSLGLRLVTILAEDQLNGTIRVDRTEGTEVHITFGVD
ncbi:MAG: sensor histidine kinase, partial [Theionarchaea archaeon]|nr:sensor histidine kinase [Theionarchaea archaeon]